MIPISLRISGFLSYRESNELTFESFDLACISGANGAGKSSLLDAITWALFGEARRRDDSVINDASDQAEVIFDFRYEDACYRVQRLKKRGKTTLLDFLIRSDAEHWKPLTEHTITETEKRIVDILRMDYETFINASFFLQGKADLFAQQKVADRKRILANILGLEQWEHLKEKAAVERRNRELEENTLSGSIREIEQELGEEGTRLEKLEQVEKSLAFITATREEKERSIELIHTLSRSLEEQRKTVNTIFEQLDDMEKQLAKASVLLAEREDESIKQQSVLGSAEEIEAENSRWKAGSDELKKIEAKAMQFRELDTVHQHANMEIEKETASLTAEKKTLNDLQARTIKITKERVDVEEKINKIKTQLESLGNAVDMRNEGEKALNQLTGEQARLTAENIKLKAEMDELHSRIETLKKNEKAECPLCEQKLTEHHQHDLLGKLENEGKSKADQYRKNQAELDGIKKQLSETEVKLELLKKDERAYQLQQQNLVQLQAVLNGQDEQIRQWKDGGEERLKAVETWLASGTYAMEQRKIRENTEKKIQALGYSADLHQKLRKEVDRMASIDERMRELEKARAALAPLEREIMSIKQQAASLTMDVEKKRIAHEQAKAQFDHGAASLPDLHAEESQLKELRQQENGLRMELGSARQKVDVLAILKGRLDEYREKQNSIRQEIAHIRMLEKAYGRDGIPALLIEQSLPDIEERANEILDHLSGGSMSLRFETQRTLKVRDEKKEALEIMINDAAGQREYELFSGGEAFRVNFAIRLALSHLLAQRSGARLQTLIIDEGFGSQDAEGRQRLIEAINIVKPDFEKILVITHLEELKDAFPTRIEVEKAATGSRLKVVTV